MGLGVKGKILFITGWRFYIFVSGLCYLLWIGCELSSNTDKSSNAKSILAKWVGSMEYKETEALLEEDDGDGSSDTELPPNILDIEDEELDTWPEELALDALNKKTKVSPVRFSLEKRRAIEDYLEQRRLREEFDYEIEDP
ncbi:hypothetical protein FQR65_LT15615 [Abscondita terminalis]|nr:hypothetical protein FQR65_LT15615 [Abscondita terminalis]